VSEHYTGGFRANFKRCESDHEALADVIAAAKDQRGAPPITTMGSVAPALNAAANMAMKDPDAFAAVATGLSMVNFAAAVEADDVSDLSQAPPPPPAASVTTLPKPPKADKAANAAAAAEVASASVVFTCSMCERRFRLQQSAEMHNQTRHNGQATVQMVDLTKEDGSAGVAVSGGASAAAAAVRGRRVPDVPVPQARRLAAEEVEAFARAAPEFRKPRSKLGARIPTLLNEFDCSEKAAAASPSGTNDDAAGEHVSMAKIFAAQEVTVPDEVQLHASASLVSSATFMGRIVAVESEDSVAPLQFAEPQPVVTVVLAVASEPLTGSEAFAESLLEGDTSASPDAEERIRVVMPAGQVPGNIDVGKTMHVTGRLRCQQVWSTDLGRHVPAAYVVPRLARVF
jgi:hypothetical protein